MLFLPSFVWYGLYVALASRDAITKPEASLLSDQTCRDLTPFAMESLGILRGGYSRDGHVQSEKIERRATDFTQRSLQH